MSNLQEGFALLAGDPLVILIISFGALIYAVVMWLSSSESFYYWRCPVVCVVDDAMAQDIELPVLDILTKPAPGYDLSWNGQRRYADALRAKYYVRKLRSKERTALLNEKRRRKREGTILAG